MSQSISIRLKRFTTHSMVVVTTSALLFAGAPVLAAPTTIFADGFESNNFAAWDSPVGSNFTISGGTCREWNDHNVIAVKITGAQSPHGTILKKSVSTAGFDHLMLSFCYKWDDLENGDVAVIEYTTNGTVWNTIKTIDNTTVRHMFYAADDTEIATSNGVGQIPTAIPTSPDELASHALALPADAANQPGFALRIREQMTDGNDFVWMDDFRLTGTPTSSSSSPNLIPNPSLETASSNPALPQSWLKGGWGTNTRTLTYPVPGQDGVAGAKVEITAYTNGDAKWYFQDVPVTAGQTYAFSDWYQSNIPSYVAAQLRTSGGTLSYLDIGTAPSSPASWKNFQGTITIPANIASLTIIHLIKQIGFLTTDNFSLQSQTVAPPPPTNAVPNPSVETASATSTLPQSWHTGRWGTNTTTFTYPTAGIVGSKAIKVDVTSYTSGDAKWYFDDVSATPGTLYTFSDRYTSTVDSEPTVQFTFADGTNDYLSLDVLPPAPTPTQTTLTFTAPANVVSMTVFHLIAGVGSLTTDDYSITH